MNEAKRINLRLDGDVAELVDKAEWETRKNQTELINECLRVGLRRFAKVQIKPVPVTLNDKD